MPLTAEQRKVLATIKQVAARKGATPKQVKAAIETGLVESNLSNPSGGTADSAGWRQERRSLYKNPTDLSASVSRFFDETAKVKDRYGKAGDLAAAVQRPAAQFRGRYQDNSSAAQALLGGKTSSGSTTTSSSKVVGKVDNSSARKALIASFIQDGNPAFTNGTKAEGQNTSDPLKLAMGLRGLKDNPGHVVTTTKTTPGSSSSSASLPAGAADFEGKKVAAWIAPALKYARAHGWKGSVSSGLRTFADQQRIYNSGVRPAAKPGTSNHEGTQFPRGAVDVTDASTLARVLRGSPYASRLVWAGGKDPVHFSHPHDGSY